MILKHVAIKQLRIRRVAAEIAKLVAEAECHETVR
jgi:hypothetical protein